MIKNTAILIFANSASLDAQLKPFKHSNKLFEALNEHTINIVERTGLPYFHITEKEQIGNSFAERFSNAIQFVFDQGYKNIITLGNDTANLKTSHLQNTLQKLKDNDIVLGPSRDGGFYLMGLKKSHFNYSTFRKLPWQTDKLFRSIGKLISLNRIKASFLEVLIDIDTAEDVNSIAHTITLLPRKIRNLLLKIIQRTRAFQSGYFLISKDQKFLKHFNKGSPISFIFN